MRCPFCTAEHAGENRAANAPSSDIQRCGTYTRKSDSRTIQLFTCKRCRKRYSSARKDPAFNQNKRRINHILLKLLASNVSMRRAAKLLGVSRTTIARKLIFLGQQARKQQAEFLSEHKGVIQQLQFDELQTIEHTKCKPLSVAVAVSVENRKILGIEVARMPATGHLAAISRKKYGFRPDHRKKALRALFRNISATISEKTTLYSDEHPYYKPIIKQVFKGVKYHQHKGDIATVSGQGELKRNRRDPLFYINHTLAMLRANINRLIRKTWCTTKNPDRLRDHLAIYMWVHNTMLTPT